MEHPVKLVKQVHKFVFVLDNIDWTVKVHDMTAYKQNQSVHAAKPVSFLIVFPKQISLIADKPQQSLSKIDIIKLLTETDNDKTGTKERYKGIIAL